MSIVSAVFEDFFHLDAWVWMIERNDYSMLRTGSGLLVAIAPLLPLLLVIEFVRALWTNTLKLAHYRATFLVYLFNQTLSAWISFSVGVFMIGLLTPFAPFSLRVKWYSLIYGYLVYELGTFIYHYAAHKVRFLWCSHSTHHAPESMNLMVSRAEFCLEAPFREFVRVPICILLGLNPLILFYIYAVDILWSDFNHVGENLLKDGRLGWLQSWILTPSHHRVHHARNPLYRDTNFCTLLKCWDWVFGTLQDEQMEVPPEYGITRKVDAGSFFDICFGEFFLLARDVWRAPGLVNKLLYIVMPPGWCHTGDHKTATILRQSYIERHATLGNVCATAGIEGNLLSAFDARVKRDISPVGELATEPSGLAR